MNKIALLLVALIAVLVVTLSAQAVSPIRSGEKNFERAWKSLMLSSPDKAMGYFATAADAFAEALAQDPPSRNTNFPSNLMKAGMSFYYADRYQESLGAMGRLKGNDSKQWEVNIFSALSYGMLGDKAKMMDALESYAELLPGQAILSQEVEKQFVDLQNGNVTPEDAAIMVEKQLVRQYMTNVNRHSSWTAGNERCNGAYWWRYNRSPCEDNQFIPK